MVFAHTVPALAKVAVPPILLTHGGFKCANDFQGLHLVLLRVEDLLTKRDAKHRVQYACVSYTPAQLTTGKGQGSVSFVW